jgi:hypothetical protein
MIAPGQSQFAASVLKGIGAPVTPGNIAGFVGWAKAEGGSNWQRNNPLNTTESAGASSTFNSVGVRGYPNPQAGVAATVKTLRNGDYGGILQAFKTNNPHALGGAIGSSPWGTSGSLAAQTIADTLKQGGAQVPTGGIQVSLPQLGSKAGGASPVGSTTETTQVLNQPAFKQANARYIAGSFLSKSATTNPYGSDGPSPLLASGLLTTKAPNPADYQVAQTVLQKVAGATPLKTHPSAVIPAAKIPKGIVQYAGKPVAAWIAPILAYAKQHGWQGSVNSGYRSLAQQTAIYNSGVRPAAKPGTSNHEMTAFPGGAVDVSDAQQLSQILLKSPYAKTLVYAGSKDPVHFSHPVNGHY